MLDIVKLAEAHKECPSCRGPFKPVLEQSHGFNMFDIGTDHVGYCAVSVTRKRAAPRATVGPASSMMTEGLASVR